uniref:Uncharacterized protein n=1 Tax=Anguilla anguilla TaxID=7936 RepID=A0A0E9WUV4_ANGAN
MWDLRFSQTQAVLLFPVSTSHLLSSFVLNVLKKLLNSFNLKKKTTKTNKKQKYTG